MFVRFRSRGSGIVAIGLDAAACAVDGRERRGQCGAYSRYAKQAAGQHGAQSPQCIAPIRARKRLFGLIGQRQRCAQVVGEHFGGKVLLQGEIGEPRNRFERGA